MKKYHIYWIIIVLIIAAFIIFGARIGGILAVLFGAGAGVKEKINKQEDVIEQKEKEYDEAGDDIEAKKHTDHQSAANTIDDILDDSDSE